MNISVVIPTKDRPDDLSRCLASLLSQTSVPEEIIVIDDGHLPQEWIEKWERQIREAGSSFIYRQKSPPGTASSRNMGVTLAKNEIVCILDDDAEAASNAFDLLKREWEARQEEDSLAGIGGLIENLRKPGFLERVYKSIFLLNGNQSWDVTPTGFQVWDPTVKSATDGFFLTGGTASFRKSVLKEIPFIQRGEGRSPGEDTEFFWMAKKKGFRFLLLPTIRFKHRESPEARESESKRGFKEGKNQKEIFFAHADLTMANKLRFAWSMFGWILRQALRGKLHRALGMTRGVLS